MDLNGIGIERAYVQKKDGEWLNETAYTVMRGCRDLCIPITPYDSESFADLDIRPDTLVHGWIRYVHLAFEKLGVPIPNVEDLPAALEPWLGRRVWTTTLGEVRHRRGLFAKPLVHRKAFTGLVLDGSLGALMATAQFPDDMPVLASDLVHFVTEYRLFVSNRVIIAARHYRGDFTQLIDFEVAEGCVRAWEDQPVSWSLDLGVTREGATLVVEVNDAYALGCYGMAPIPYVQMVEARWVQIVGDRRGD